MENEMVPKTHNADVVSGIPNSEGTVNIPEEYLGGLSFIKHRVDKDRNLIINDVTGEEKSELLVRICGVKMERVNIEDGELLCVSRDSVYSKDGVLCDTCPNVFNKPYIGEDEMRNKYVADCKKHNIANPPPWNSKTKCNFRLVVQWVEEFEKNADGNYTWIHHPGLCYLSCPISSLAAMTFRGTGYLSRLKSRGYADLKHVVTIIGIGQRRNEKMKINYFYETFELEGTYEEITKKCINYADMVKVLDGQPQIGQSVAPAPAVQHKPAPVSVTQPAPKKTSPAPSTAPHVEPSKSVQPESAKTEQPAQTVGKITELRLKIKYVFATLPIDVQKIVLGVLTIDAIDKVIDNDLNVAFETLELAKKEVANRATPPVADSTPPSTETQANAKKTNPW